MKKYYILSVSLDFVPTDEEHFNDFISKFPDVHVVDKDYDWSDSLYHNYVSACPCLYNHEDDLTIAYIVDKDYFKLNKEV